MPSIRILAIFIFPLACVLAAPTGDVIKEQQSGCPLRVNPEDDTSYLQHHPGLGWLVRPCSPATVFSLKLCVCATKTVATAAAIDDSPVGDSPVGDSPVDDSHADDSPAVESPVETSLVCEHDKFDIGCVDGQLHIISAYYGRTRPVVCPGRNDNNTNCPHPVLDTLTPLCENRSFCNVPVENHVFTDPCVGTFKYLFVEYKCVIGLPPSPQDNETEQAKVSMTSPGCPLRGNPENNTSFLQELPGLGWQVMPCGPGTIFDLNLCTCALPNM